jgi:DNA (cytosine-5)-methyltransferase 1
MNMTPSLRGACSALSTCDRPGKSDAGSVTPAVTMPDCDTTGETRRRTDTVLSIFPGIDMLGMGFEQAGFCVVRGPDPIFGGDIRAFNPPRGVFDGIIGGPPCQDFSKKRRTPPTGYGTAMIDEYKRVVLAAQPEWWLMENVPEVPDVRIPGYSWQRLDLRASEFGMKQNRRRHFQYGHRDAVQLILPRHVTNKATEPCCLASEGKKSTRRSWSDFCELQGLPGGFALPGFTQAGRYRAVGNGVPIPMARALALAIKHPVTGTACACSCGRPVTGKARYATAACRKREQRRRDKAAVTVPGNDTPGQSQSGEMQ